MHVPSQLQTLPRASGAPKDGIEPHSVPGGFVFSGIFFGGWGWGRDESKRREG